MPLLRIQTNTDIPQPNTALLQQASRMVAEILGKPERYVMVILENNPHMLFAGSTEPLAYLEFKSIGLPGDQTARICADLSSLLEQRLNIPAQRIYIEFADAQRHMWGWNGGTF